MNSLKFLYLILLSFGCFVILTEAQCILKDDYRFELKDTKGVLIKKLCFVYIRLNYTEAINYCRNQSMNILLVNSMRTRLALESVVLKAFKEWDMSFRIDGVRVKGTWKVVNATRDFYTKSKSNWVESYDTPPGDDTLSYTSEVRPFKKWTSTNYYFDGYPASERIFLFCEY